MGATSERLGYAALKDKHRTLRAGFPQDLTLRVHRALIWLGRAERETGDDDVRFILIWIAFNAAYAGEISAEASSERDAFKTYFSSLVELDVERRIDRLVWARFSQEIRLLLMNRHVFAPFWAHQAGVPGNDDWEERLSAGIRKISAAMARRETATVLSVLFDRLYVLRNQLVHGAATWNGGVNRDQVRVGAAILSSLVPIFIDLMMDDPTRDWGAPFYPVTEG